MTTHKPDSEESLSALVKDACSHARALSIRGGGTRPVGNPVHAKDTIDMTAMSGITLYEPGALTIGAKAGTPLADIEKALAKEKQQLQFEPANWAGFLGTKGKSTIGGVVAAGVSGPRRIQAGGMRDALIGVRFVDGEGNILKNGGRVMKNVTGYDLVKLMAGSYGTLGVMTEVIFKVLPKPAATGTVLVQGLDDQAAIGVLAAALGSPFDVSGAAHVPMGVDDKPVTMIRVEGLSESVNYRCERLKELASAKLGAGAEISIELDAKKTLSGWQWVREVETFHGREGAVWRISVKPGDGPRIVDVMRNSGDCEVLYDWGGGLIWALVADTGDAMAGVIRNTVGAMGGHATLMRASEDVHAQVEAFQPEMPRVAMISEQLRRQFDPQGIFNPGLMSRGVARNAA